MFSITKLPSQQGKIAIVTGANIGLGFETALGLISKNITLIIASRNEEKATVARLEMLTAYPEAKIDIILLDLADTASIDKFAVAFKSKYEKLDLLINNAGIMIPPYRETAQGFESQFGVNYLGHFYLTSLLLEHLDKADQARIVTLSSLAHRKAEIHFDNINQKDSYKPMKSYGQSKLACLIFAYELQRKLSETGSRTISLGAHPGVAMTNLFHSAPKWMQLIAPLFRWMFNSVKEGSQPSLMAALDPSMNGGEYIGPTGSREMKGKPGIVDSNQISKDVKVGEKLWNLSEEMLGCEFQV